MIETLDKLDQQLFLFFNGFHNSTMDVVMYWVSHKFFWIPLYALLVGLVIYRKKYEAFPILIAVAILVTLADQLSVHLFKEVFERYRPCRMESPIHELVHTVNRHCGGKYGFISSHATNVFAIAVFMNGILKPYYKYLSGSLFAWASLVAYSRVYLGVHYTGDIFIGALFGSVLGYLILKTTQFLIKNHKKNILR